MLLPGRIALPRLSLALGTTRVLCLAFWHMTGSLTAETPNWNFTLAVKKLRSAHMLCERILICAHKQMNSNSMRNIALPCQTTGLRLEMHNLATLKTLETRKTIF